VVEPRGRRAVAGVSLALILGATLATLAIGALFKQPCATGSWADGRQYKRLCYSDIVPLYGTEHLQGSRLPFLDACPTDGGGQCDEYPVLTMYFMRAAAWLGHSYSGFYYANAVLLSICALVTAWALYRIGGDRALYFAAAPTLLIYAFVNWDLFAVVLASAATLAYLRDQDEVSGALLGLGAAAKLYPAFLLVPFVLGRLRDKRRAGAVQLSVWATVAYAAVNLPFVLAAGKSWTTFFRFNARRGVDWDSLWFVACRGLHGGLSCPWSNQSTIKQINELSVLIFLAVATGLWWARRARHPNFPRWTFGFPLIVVFLLTNKVYSPQYGLWLLPWFALSLPSLPLFLAFEATDVFVFITRFSWFGRLSGLGGASLGQFQLALILRAGVLLACLVAWVLRPDDEALSLPARASQAPALAKLAT
jgi:uncharacterized membrane protein